MGWNSSSRRPAVFYVRVNVPSGKVYLNLKHRKPGEYIQWKIRKYGTQEVVELAQVQQSR